MANFWKRMWCATCKIMTQQECLPEVQSVGGLTWRCEKCLRTQVLTAFVTSLYP